MMHTNQIFSDQASQYVPVDIDMERKDFRLEAMSNGIAIDSSGDVEIASRIFAKRGRFVEFCAWLRKELGPDLHENSYFPLRGKIRLRSNVSLIFSDQEIHAFNLSNGVGTLRLNILTLAGINGVLPLKISEDIIFFKRRGGESLHEFLDLINLRYWEIFFQSYRIGVRPQYGFNSPVAERLIVNLAQGYVGIDCMPKLDREASSPNFNTGLLRHCFLVGSGSGGQGSLEELLSHAVSRPVCVDRGVSCKAPVPRRFQFELGRSSHPPALGRFSILGRYVAVRQLLVISLTSSLAELFRFLPVVGGVALRGILEVLNITLAGRISLAAACYKVTIPEGESGLLGRSTFRLAWGAVLGNAGPHTQFIQVSNTAMEKIKGEK